MSSPGNSCCRCCCSVLTPAVDDDVVLLAQASPQTIRLTVPAPLPSTSTSRALTTTASAIAGIGHRDAGDVEVGHQHGGAAGRAASTRSTASAGARPVRRAGAGPAHRRPRAVPSSDDADDHRSLTRHLTTSFERFGRPNRFNADKSDGDGGGGGSAGFARAGTPWTTRVTGAGIRARPSARPCAYPWFRSAPVSSGLRSVSMIWPSRRRQRDALGVVRRHHQRDDRGRRPACRPWPAPGRSSCRRSAPARCSTTTRDIARRR